MVFAKILALVNLPSICYILYLLLYIVVKGEFVKIFGILFFAELGLFYLIPNLKEAFVVEMIKLYCSCAYKYVYLGYDKKC